MDEATFTRLYEKYWMKIVRYINLTIKMWDVSEQLAQDCFLGMYRHHTYCDDRQTEYYLYRSAKNVVISYVIRKSKHWRNDQHLELSIEHDHEEHFDYGLSLDLQEALAALDPRERVAIEMVVLQGYRVYELANSLGLSRSRASNILTRAKANLARSIEAVRLASTVVW